VLRVNLQDGSTVSVDLERDMERWSKLKADPAFQRSIRGALIVIDGCQHTMPLPVGFNGPVVYDAELVRDTKRGGAIVAERVVCYVDCVRITLTVYVSSLVMRVDVARVGRLRHTELRSAPYYGALRGGSPTERPR
jgi:hypothetical protein